MRTIAERTPMEDVEASSRFGPNRDLLLPTWGSPTAPNNAPSGPTTVASASRIPHGAAGGPSAVTTASRGPTIVVSDPRAVAAAAALREAHSRPATLAPPPKGPRAERASGATQAVPRMRHVAQILQHPRTVQRPSGVAQGPHSSSQAPPNAPRGPRADSRPSNAQSNAPPNAPRAPRADYRPSQPPRNAPQAPRGQHWQYQIPQDDPQAHRAQNWQYQAHRNVVHGDASTSQTPQNVFNAPQAAPRAPRAMQQTPPTTPHWTPQITEPFVGATHPTTYPYSLYTSPPCPTYYGPYAFSRPATYQYMEEMPYYQVLQDYYQWHASGPSGGGPWNVAPPDNDEVMRHGMILRFLDSLPPPPTNPEFPPDPPQLYHSTRRRRRNRTQSSRESGATGQTGSTEGTTAITRTIAPTASADVTSPQVAQRKPYRRGERGESGKHRRAAENNADGSERSGERGAAVEAVEFDGAAEAVESANLGEIVETSANGQDDRKGEERDDGEDGEIDDEIEDDRASSATCMW